PMAPLTSTMPTRAPADDSMSEVKLALFSAEYASSMKPNSTRNRPPKMTASTTAARLSIGVRLLPLAPSGYKRSVPFRRMLTSLVERTPGARGAVFCDFEGEFVELVVRDQSLTDYDMKIFGAQMAAAWLNLQNNSSERGAGGIVEMRL